MYASYKGKMEIAVWRRSDGNWYISPQNRSHDDRGDTRRVANLGGPNDIPVPADYDGDGKANIAVWKPATGEWQILDYNGQKQVTFQWGQVMNRDDTPVPANYRHTKKAQLAVFRERATCEWWISSVDIKSWSTRNKVENYKYLLGKPGDVPIPADYNNDGVVEIGVFNPTSCTWSWRTLDSTKVHTEQFGKSGDIPFPGRYLDRRKTILACYRPSTKQWLMNGQDPIDLPWVQDGDKPVPGDYSNNGKTDIAFWRPSESIWLVYQPGQAEPQIVNWGLAGEMPVAANYGMGDGVIDVPAGHGARHAKFVRLFPDLPAHEADPAALARLGQKGGIMEDDEPFDIEGTRFPHPNGDNQKIPAAYTYFGQFLDHDITFDPTSLLDSINDPELIRNFRTPRLELDNVYGMGPDNQPYLFNEGVVQDGATLVHPEKLLFGSNGNPQGDLMRNEQGTAIIGDMRNDENLAVAQIQLAFIKFHNAVVDQVKAEGLVADSAVFGEAQRIVRWHYQWMVINDYLVRICGQDNVDHVLNNGRRFYLKDERVLLDPDMPIEFSIAAYRFGHSQVRQHYAWNTEFGPKGTTFPGTMDQLFRFTKDPVPPIWNVEFERILDVQNRGDGQVENKTRKIDTKLAAELLDIPGLPAPSSLAERNLKRGLAFNLPSGQTVARHMGIPVLRSSELPADIRDELARLNLLEETPLWYYILLESEVRENGDRLGQVGAQIVADVMIGLVQLDPDSYLNSMERDAEGNVVEWRPHLPSATPGHFTLADLVNMAGWVRQGQLGRRQVPLFDGATPPPPGGGGDSARDRP